MRKTRLFMMTIVPLLLMLIIACNKDQAGNTEVSEKPEKNSASAIDDTGNEEGLSGVSVSTIDRYEQIAISDWLDEDTVVISKDNEKLGKMSLSELSDSYPKSLYLYHLDTSQHELLKEQKNVFLGEASLSPDKKHLLYSEYSLGDPVYHVLDMNTLDSFGIVGDPIAGALSANWSRDGTVIGAAYSGGAYMASSSGKLATIPELNTEALYIVRKIKSKIYYNTQSDESLQAIDLTTQEKTQIDFDHVYGVFPSPDDNRMLVLQFNDPILSMILCDVDGSNRKIIAEGTELGGISWSSDQRLFAYSLKSGEQATDNGLYIYDLLTDKSTRIAIDIESPTTSWSPSGLELAISDRRGNQYNSSIVHLTYS